MFFFIPKDALNKVYTMHLNLRRTKIQQVEHKIK